MRIDDYDYPLPPGRIAQRPVEPRDASRLLVLERSTGNRRDARFPEIVDVLAPGDLLVVNDTRVFPARLFATGEDGGRVEFLLTRPADTDEPERASGTEWWALARPSRRARPGRRLAIVARAGTDAAVEVVEEAEAGVRRIRLDVPDDPWDWITEHGHVPLPPYIHRPDDPADRDRYQTVYARRRGAVAAPTAGLHFTPELLNQLERRGIGRATVTLHVGPGTFRPVAAERVEDHAMEGEWYEVPAATAEALARARAAGGRIVAVGTTTVRALESAAAVRGRTAGLAGGVSGWTDLTIVPGHEFRLVDTMVTNFHLPRSSLLLLVAAFAGRERVLDAYGHAVEAGYRFYSYGDAMLIV
ncbi:MAG TPA: tRNA preQ1(34) S-adenosylmethionine ribosyltransferase-isomerase QueA [Gemmatimonadota bacterium]|nr:tRNA preQ1(34) S-adenosylmethionine ribosyltransferase-isomerase QueA [Gemmatimonadota bacterium]